METVVELAAAECVTFCIQVCSLEALSFHIDAGRDKHRETAALAAMRAWKGVPDELKKKALYVMDTFEPPSKAKIVVGFYMIVSSDTPACHPMLRDSPSTRY